MRKQTQQRAASANRTNRREKTSSRFSSLDKYNQFEKDRIRQLNTEEYLDLLPRKCFQPIRQQSSAKTIFNLPEFQYFQSDHLVLIPQIASHPFYDRLRGSSAFSTTKFNRQSTTNNNNISSQPTTTAATATTVGSGGSPRSSYSSTKRLSRSRQSHDSTINHEQQQQTHVMRPPSLRQMTNKFDSITCFKEVSRLVIFFFGLIFFPKQGNIHCPKGKNDEDESAYIPNKIRL
jgi:hypothetical protein